MHEGGGGEGRRKEVGSSSSSRAARQAPHPFSHFLSVLSEPHQIDRVASAASAASITLLAFVDLLLHVLQVQYDFAQQ